MGRLRLPGWLWNVYLPLLQPTVASAVAIAASSSATPLGAVCAAVGLAACVAPCAAAALLATRWFAATPQRSRESATEVSSFVALRLWRRLVREETAYADAVRGSEFVRRYGALFARYRGGRHWFVAVEAVHQVLLGVVRGTVGVAALGGSCAAPVAAAVAVAAVMLAAVALLRPYNTLLEACVGNAELALLLLGCVLILSVGGVATARFLEAEMCVGIVAALLPFAADTSRLVRWLLRSGRLQGSRAAGRRVSGAVGAPGAEPLRVVVELICSSRASAALGSACPCMRT
jgi:hypothetical protein